MILNNLILLVRADPIICGHSTEARNLAEAAHELGFDNIHIVSYPINTLEQSDLPLKHPETVSPYSPGIHIDRPEPLGDYKVLDGRLSLGISGHLADLLHRLPGRTMLMDLYLVPHGIMAMQAVHSFRHTHRTPGVFTVGEAVGSDITNVVSNAVAQGRLGAAQLVLSNYLDHDLPVAVSRYTRDLIVEAGTNVDDALGTRFAEQLQNRVGISYPAIDTQAYLDIESHTETNAATLRSRDLKPDGYVMFLSRLAFAKGVDDLVHAWRASKIRDHKKLIICGNGPAKQTLLELTADLPEVRILDDVSDAEKSTLMHHSHAWCLPSKPSPEFTETFGIAVAEKMLAGGPGPVITTRTGGIPEASGGHCLEHPAGDIDALRHRLDQLATLSGSDRHTLSQSARRFAQSFDSKTILNKLLEHAAPPAKLTAALSTAAFMGLL